MAETGNTEPLVIEHGGRVLTLKEGRGPTVIDGETGAQFSRSAWERYVGAYGAPGGSVFTSTDIPTPHEEERTCVLRVFTSRSIAKVRLSLDDIRRVKDWCTEVLARDAARRLVPVAPDAKQEAG